jgi:hypothetical protein
MAKTPLQHILDLLTARIRRAKAAGHTARAARAEKARRDLLPPSLHHIIADARQKPAPRPYGRTTVRGHTLDNLTDYALLAVEAELGYNPRSLTILQGSYNAGGVGASAGTHDGGGAVDLTPVNAEPRSTRSARSASRPGTGTAIPGVWNEHIHAVLIGNEKLSDAAAAQVADYRNHRDGLAGHGPDNTWHPDPIPTFHMPKYAQ